MNNLLNIRATIYDFFVVVSLLVQSKASGCADVACSWHKCSQGKSKLTQSDALTAKVMTIAAASSVMSRLYDITSLVSHM